jgi:RNA polymerase sigma-70 factor, ECF subfamily
MGELVPFRRISGEVHELSDEALVSAAGARDRAALGALFDRFSADVYRFVARIASAYAADLDDLVQATFLEAYRSATRFTRRSTVKTWLFGIAVNVVRHHRRSEGRRAATLQRFSAVERRPATRPDAAAERAEDVAKVGRAIDALAPALREAYVLCVVEELSAKEAATALGASEGSVWRRVHEARVAIRRAVEAEP